MKKIIALAAAAILALAIVSCGEKCDNCGERGDCTEILGMKICEDCMNDAMDMAMGGF